MNTEHTGDHTTEQMDDDLAGANWDYGPRLERLDGRYLTPAIVDDASSIRGKIGVRAGFVADHLEVKYSSIVTDAIANRLRRLSLRLGSDDAFVDRQDTLKLDVLREHGAEIEEGPRGLWVVVRNLDDVKESLENGED
jgi:hypothetical protein